MQQSRIGLFLLDCMDPQRLLETVERIPPDVAKALAEIVAVHDRPGGEVDVLVAGGLRALRAPRALGYGDARKAAFESAIARGLTHAITMRGDGTHPPARLEMLLEEIGRTPHALLVATRRRAPGAPRVGNAIGNRLLGLRLRDPQSGFRAVPIGALACIPFQLSGDGDDFDAHTLIQFRALDAEIREVTGHEDWTEAADRHPLTALGAALDYRGHQLHASRRHRYMVDEGAHYTLKLSPTGSHMQIVDAIAPNSTVLDLGCSQGLLARPLAEKGVRVTGVDVEPRGRIAEELFAFHQRDLEQPLVLPVAPDFDYVVVADVIEHVRNRGQLLRSARRYLRPGGRLIISTPNIAIWFYRLSLLAGRFEYGPRGVLDETHVHLYTGATFRREVERAGLQILGQRVTALPFEVVFQSTGRSRAVRALADFYHALARAWPSMFAYQHILEAESRTPSDPPL